MIKNACQFSHDSTLYGTALVVKAYAQIREGFSGKPEEKKLFRKAQELLSLNPTLQTLYQELNSGGDLHKEILSKLTILHSNRDTELPYLDVCFILLLAETLNLLVNKSGDSFYDGFSLGKAFTELASNTEWGGIDDAFYIFQNVPSGRKLYQELFSIANKYCNQKLEERLNELRNMFEKCDITREINCTFLEKSVRNLLSKEMKNISISKKTYYLLLSSEHSHYRTGFCSVKNGEYNIVCNLWPLFLGNFWKIVVIHELFEGIFQDANVRNPLPKKSNSLEREICIDSISSLRHSLIHFLTIKTINDQTPDISLFKNVAISFIPTGEIMGMMWYNSLEEKIADITLQLPQILCSSGLDFSSKDPKEYLIEILKKIDYRYTGISSINVPDPILFCSKRILQLGLKKIPDDNPLKTRLKESSVARAVFITLITSKAPLSLEEISKHELGFFRKFFPEIKYTRKEICQAIETLSSSSIIIKKGKKYQIPQV